MSFLALLRELRNQVYGYITDLSTHAFVDYSGLYMSCRLIKDELDYEGARNLKARFEQLQLSFASETGLLLNIPDASTFRGLRRAELSLSNKIYVLFSPGSSIRFMPYAASSPSLQSLFSLHLDSLTLGFHNEDEPDKGAKVFLWHGEWLSTNVLKIGPPCARRLIIEFRSLMVANSWSRAIHSNLDHWELEECVTGYGARTVFRIRTTPVGVVARVREYIRDWWVGEPGRY
jgi:hypothetical protein